MPQPAARPTSQPSKPASPAGGGLLARLRTLPTESSMTVPEAANSASAAPEARRQARRPEPKPTAPVGKADFLSALNRYNDEPVATRSPAALASAARAAAGDDDTRRAEVITLVHAIADLNKIPATEEGKKDRALMLEVALGMFAADPDGALSCHRATYQAELKFHDFHQWWQRFGGVESCPEAAPRRARP